MRRVGSFELNAEIRRASLSSRLLCCAGRLNQQAPRKVSQRVFKLSWLLPTVAAGCLFFWLASTAFINAPTRLQTTNGSLITAHEAIRATCQTHLDNNRYDEAYSTISVRTKTSELVGEHARKMKEIKQHKSSLARMMQPILNSLLFHTGVTIVFIPALLRLLLLLWKIQRQGADANDPKFVESVRREWGVFLPVRTHMHTRALCGTIQCSCLTHCCVCALRCS